MKYSSRMGQRVLGLQLIAQGMEQFKCNVKVLLMTKETAQLHHSDWAAVTGGIVAKAASEQLFHKTWSVCTAEATELAAHRDALGRGRTEMSAATDQSWPQCSP